MAVVVPSSPVVPESLPLPLPSSEPEVPPLLVPSVSVGLGMGGSSVVGPIIGAVSVGLGMGAISVVPASVVLLLSSSLHAAPDSDSSSAPIAGRTSAGPRGGAVKPIVFEAMP